MRWEEGVLRPPVPSGGRFLSLRVRSSPSGLRRFAGPGGLHPLPPTGAPVAWSSGAWPFRDSRLVGSPFRSALRGVPPLRRPLLTARSAASSATSPFRASGELSPGKSPDLPCIAAGSTPPDPWLRELRGYWPARPGRLRLVSGSCSSAHRFVPRFLRPRPHGRRLAVPLGSCNLVPGRTCTSSSVPMLGAPNKKRPGSKSRPPSTTSRG